MHMHIQHTQIRIRITLNPVRLHRRAQQGLRQNQLRELMQHEQVRVGLEELRQQPLQREVVHLRVRVEKLEVDVDEALLG